ncbi:OLC1v1038417C1 [Oldenlandia corymbosa var. corymbosa]|uniref:OLC1v1038417C1 n=1 Tax=Oldenlandia corymbosa var. corymbosa TaxID=529605 RepID=A0AAV1CZP5_OLDCO|nr:OLC1v1038417C1 [Oldenlandia corymbosa var. corymbosa]
MGAIKAAVADGVLTFMWVFSISSLGTLNSLLTAALPVPHHHHWWSSLLTTTCLVCVFLFVFGIIGHALGGATFNPTATAAFHAVGLGGSNSLYSTALRFPAQAVGAVGGALAIQEFMPAQYKHMLGGPSLKVDLHTGAIAEGVLTFVITFLVLGIVLKGPKSPIVKNFLIAVCTVALVIAGSGYTGPSMNPANAFGWAYVNKRHDTWEQFYVYWICPFVGAILAAWTFRWVFPAASGGGPKKTSAKKKKA